ncbi:unnamed protein product [Polarella glacialis]|uniref:RanBP2-type domain-containing protein n=1 Tax=Polarella glacialis TaxID=89957 RepID=A0A813GPP7_POLGL|nr:unnamed protein product [Polarella glacialis]
MSHLLRTGQTLQGMVKSYNRKGFGFIMCQAIEQDIYFSRESLHPNLQTSDLAGENIQFEIHRFPDGKLQARNLRPMGDVSDFKGSTYGGNREYGAGSRAMAFSSGRNAAGLAAQDEDRTRDWICSDCKERNFVKRNECFKCKALRPREDGEEEAPLPTPGQPRRTISPHSGSRAMREQYKANLAAKNGNADAATRSRSRKRQQSSSSSSSSSPAKKKRKKKKSKKKRSRSSSGSSSSSVKQVGEQGSADGEKAATQESNPEVEDAKKEALEKLMKLKTLEPKEARLKEWRLLLREWHPDKNLQRLEVATAVFQFLQKGKALIDCN